MVRGCVLEAGTGIFDGLENVSVVKGCSKIFLNDAPFFSPLTRLEPSPLVLILVMGPSAGFSARTGGPSGVTSLDLLFSLSFAARSDALLCCEIPVPVVRLVRLDPASEDESRDLANELAVGAKSVEEERFVPVLLVVGPAPMLLLVLLTLLIRLFAVPLVLVTARSSDSRFL